MLIHSAQHITCMGRNLEINLPSETAAESAILVLTKEIDHSSGIKEKTRITSETIAKSMGLRKFLKFSEETSIKVGSFELRMAEISEDKKKFNFFINNELYFLTFIPPLLFPFGENTTLLMPADSDYFAEDDFKEAENFLLAGKPCRTVISGNYAEKWLASFKSRKNIEIRNEIAQQTIF